MAVAPASLGDRVGLRPGDELVAINGQPVRDVIDVRIYASESPLRLRVQRGDDTLCVEAERRYGEPLGLDFTEPVFDRVKRCNNRCEFCFVSQMPDGLRPSLYVKDDDYRLSFLHGSYVTLTNLSKDDWPRIGEQHLSPLYVSVHATETEVRRRFLRNPEAPDVLAQLSRLWAMDITTHTQIVVRPTVNDGQHLDRSIEDLAELHPGVRSVSIVPVGLTQYHRFDCRLHTDAEMREVLDQVEVWQTRFRRRMGVTFVYLSDEWYLRLGEEVPPAVHYDGLDLTENGVGLVRTFLDGQGEMLESLQSESGTRLLVTGALFAPVLRAAVAGSNLEVVPVINRFFGESVTVAGLLTARDVMAALEGRDGADRVILPPAMFGGPQGQSLDGMWPADVEQALGRPVDVGWPETSHRGP